ncbi:hypothetical protein CFELI_04710 [Corynebacterium felinum]|uniref:Uncharacterized protein n=1 Tax=Corynebacterium felinum TaxID=131318 RepID=A0ABU2B995_9CORY|nr:hypothetical protein [Corynebacterium felinum]WJY94571.1 hypothetical protein CFELI_04710 [Corynebacterium felinum]
MAKLWQRAASRTGAVDAGSVEVGVGWMKVSTVYALWLRSAQVVTVRKSARYLWRACCDFRLIATCQCRTKLLFLVGL